MQGKAPAAAKPATTKPVDAAREAAKRRIYVNIRIEELRAELARLIEERKALAAKK